MRSGQWFRRPSAIVLAVVAALVAAVAASASGGGGVVAKNLSDPRGIAVGPKGDLLVVETGGGDESAPGAITALSRSGKDHHKKGSWDPKDESVSVPGAVDVIVGRLGQTFVVTGGGEPPAEGGAAPAAAE